VLIDGGRATADPVEGTIRYNFYRRADQVLTSATWFLKEVIDNNKKLPLLIPMSNVDAKTVEDLYQRAVYAASSFGDGIQTILKEEVDLEEETYRARVVKSGDGNYVVQKSLKGWFGKSYDLQRGFGSYVVQGEEDELTLGPVKDVIFVVHGIGEALWSRDDVMVTSLVDQMHQVRLDVNRRQVVEWKKRCEASKKQKYVPNLLTVVSPAQVKEQKGGLLLHPPTSLANHLDRIIFLLVQGTRTVSTKQNRIHSH
jgi:hypothetical protein